MKVLVASTSPLSLPTIEALLDNHHQFLGLLTKADRPAGRGQKSKSLSIADHIGARFPVYKISDQSSLIEVLGRLKPDLVIAISFGIIIKPEALIIPKYGWINLHFSILPRYRGAAPVQRAILAGETESGVTVFALDPGMDTGPVYVTKSFSIKNLDAGMALEEMSKLGAPCVISALEKIQRGESPRPQEGECTLAPKIDPEELRISFGETASEIKRKVLAFSPQPGAWCLFRGNRVKFLGVEFHNSLTGDAGEIISSNPLIVAATNGTLRIDRLQESGKRITTGAEWARGVRIQPREKFV